MANAAAAPAAATSEESLWARAATPVLVAAAETDEALFEEAVEAFVLVAVVESEVSVVLEVSVLDLIPVSVKLELELVLVLAPELELDLLLEQTTSAGRSVTPPRAQIDLATLMVAVVKCNISAQCTCSAIHYA